MVSHFIVGIYFIIKYVVWTTVLEYVCPRYKYIKYSRIRKFEYFTVICFKPISKNARSAFKRGFWTLRWCENRGKVIWCGKGHFCSTLYWSRKVDNLSKLCILNKNTLTLNFIRFHCIFRERNAKLAVNLDLCTQT